VVIPKGVFVSGPIVLTSRIDLHLADGAVLRMSDDRSLYPVTKNNRAAFISANKASDIRLSGNGIIDGQGESWWKTYIEEKAAGSKDAPRRPQLIAFKDCQRVEVEGVTTLNPPNTHYSFKQCEDLAIRNVKATAPDDSPNTDALNLSNVKNVLITGSSISTGDDNIALLCGAAKTGGVPEVENVVIRDCVMGFGHGISIGSYTSGGVRNVTVENVTFDGTTSGIRMKSDRSRGGVVEGIRYRGITMKNVRYPVFITSYYPKPPETPAADRPFKGKPLLPVWRDIVIENVAVTDSKNSIVFWGLPEQAIENITLKNVKISASAGAMVFHARNIRFSNVEIVPGAGLPLRIHNAEVHGMTGVELASERVKFK
jgi:polygalacturonase